MKEHNWEKEIITVKAAYSGNPTLCFWKCKECKASGGPAQPGDTKPAWGPFLAGTTLIDLPTDCDISKKKIAEYWEKYPANEPFIGAET